MSPTRPLRDIGRADDGAKLEAVYTVPLASVEMISFGDAVAEAAPLAFEPAVMEPLALLPPIVDPSSPMTVMYSLYCCWYAAAVFL